MTGIVTLVMGRLTLVMGVQTLVKGIEIPGDTNTDHGDRFSGFGYGCTGPGDTNSDPGFKLIDPGDG